MQLRPEYKRVSVSKGLFSRKSCPLRTPRDKHASLDASLLIWDLLANKGTQTLLYQLKNFSVILTLLTKAVLPLTAVFRRGKD